MCKKVFQFIAIFINSVFVFAQNSSLNPTPANIDTKVIFSFSTTDSLLLVENLRLGRYYENKNLDSSIFYYSQIADTTLSIEEITNHPQKTLLRLKALRSLSLAYWNLNSFNLAQTYSSIALKYSLIAKDTLSIASSLNLLGLANWNLGNFYQGVDNFNQAINYYNLIKDSTGLLRTLLNIGNVYDDLGNFESSKEYYEKALKIATSIDDKKGISNCNNNLGIVYSNLGNVKTAISYYEKSLEIDLALEDLEGISICYMNLGEAYSNINEFKKAIEYHEKSLLISEQLEDKIGIAYSLMSLGILNKWLGENELAFNQYARSIQIMEELNIVADLVKYYPNYAQLCEAMHKTELALNIYIKALNITIQQLKNNFPILNEDEKEKYLNFTQEVFNYVHIFNRLNHHKFKEVSGICYNNELILKGLLLNSTKIVYDVANNSNDAKILKTFNELKKYRELISASQNSINDDGSIQTDSLIHMASIAEAELNWISVNYAQLQKLFNYSWQDVKKCLKPNEAAIEFVRLSYNSNKYNIEAYDSIVYGALLLKHNTNFPIFVPLTNEANLLKMVGSFGWNNPSMVKTIYANGSIKGEHLYQTIWLPLEKYLTKINSIYIAPVGILNYIAFAAIPINKNTFLSQKYNINLLTSTKAIIENKNNNVFCIHSAAIYGGINYNIDSCFRKTILLHNQTFNDSLINLLESTALSLTPDEIWEYLPGTYSEAKQIYNLFLKDSVNAQLFLGCSASEDQFVKKARENNLNVIHIATHGFSFPKPNKIDSIKLNGNTIEYCLNPLFRTGLLFAGSNYAWNSLKRLPGLEDGILTAYEVSNLNLRTTNLIVLSACETGLGDIKGSEGVYGLQRAFKMAGVKYIIMSLWPVPDKETQELMLNFYSKLIECRNIHMAFKFAQQEMQKKYDPFYWAAFVLIE